MKLTKDNLAAFKFCVHLREIKRKMCRCKLMKYCRYRHIALDNGSCMLLKHAKNKLLD